MKRVAQPEVVCFGKDKLETMALAKDIATKMSRRREQAIVAYKCRHCGFYHVGGNSRMGGKNGRFKR